MDEQRQPDLRGIQLADYNGKPALMLDGAPMKDLNYLVLDVSLTASGAEPEIKPPDNVIRGVPPVKKLPFE
jgi:hypothetical protein